MVRRAFFVICIIALTVAVFAAGVIIGIALIIIVAN